MSADFRLGYMMADISRRDQLRGCLRAPYSSRAAIRHGVSPRGSGTGQSYNLHVPRIKLHTLLWDDLAKR